MNDQVYEFIRRLAEGKSFWFRNDEVYNVHQEAQRVLNEYFAGLVDVEEDPEQQW